MNEFIAVFLMVILPIGIIFLAIGNRFEGHDKEIMELKNRINKLENKGEKNGENN